MKKKLSRYIVRIDPQIAGSVAALCPQKDIGTSLSKFIEIQFNALEREHFDLIAQDCIVSLPVEIVDTLEWLYPGLPFSDQVINAVRSFVDLSFPNVRISKSDYLRDQTDHLRDLADMVDYYMRSGETPESILSD